MGEIRAGSGKEVSVDTPQGRHYIALFLAGGEVRAYLNTCPHQGRSLNFAADEFLFGPDGRLICPHHGACFTIDTGECVEGPCKGAALKAVEVEVRDGMVCLPSPLSAIFKTTN